MIVVGYALEGDLSFVENMPCFVSTLHQLILKPIDTL